MDDQLRDKPRDKPRILGVDDSLTIRKALELVLKPAGYALELAATGAEAIEKARWLRPTAVLLDFILPDMRGTEVCRRLSADPETAGIPVILISAKGAEIRQAYHDVGNVVAYVAKPFTPEAILEILADVVARSERGDLQIGLVDGAVEVPGALLGAGANGHAADGEGAASDLVSPPAFPQAVERHIAELDAAAAAECERPYSSQLDAWEETDADDSAAASDEDVRDEQRRESLETMLEALNTGLEGVYVEEVDTPTGAAADEAKSYTELVAQLTRQLGEALGQARSGARFALCGDGSIRSLDEVLFDAYRRVCRLLFRAAAGGAVGQSTPDQARVLVVCHRDSELFTALGAVLAAPRGWHAFLVAERFRQLPMLTRLYGPTHVVVDLTGSNAVWDQLGVVSAMPERRRMEVIGVSPPRTVTGQAAPETRSRPCAVDTVLECGPHLLADLERCLGALEQPFAAPAAAEIELPAAS